MRLFLGKLVYLDPNTLKPTGQTAYGAVSISESGELVSRSGPYDDADAMAGDVRRMRQADAHEVFHLAEGFVWEPPPGEHFFDRGAVVRFEGLSFHEMSRTRTILGLI